MTATIPEGYHSVTPYLVVADAGKLIDFTVAALGAQEKMRMPGPNGGVAHAEVLIGNSMVMLGSPMDGTSLMPGMLYLYVEDTDATYAKAISFGATSIEEPADQFYGDRRAAVQDPQGNQWFFATAKEQVSAEELEKRLSEINAAH